MRILAIGAEPAALIFDLDGTLYSDPEYAAFQEDVLVARLGRELGLTLAAAAARIEALRTERSNAGLGKTSLGRLFAELGIDIATSVRWREECIEPAEWLHRDARLDRALGLLSERYALALATNNPRLVGEKSLKALGVRSQVRSPGRPRRYAAQQAGEGAFPRDGAPSRRRGLALRVDRRPLRRGPRAGAGSGDGSDPRRRRRRCL